LGEGAIEQGFPFWLVVSLGVAVVGWVYAYSTQMQPQHQVSRANVRNNRWYVLFWNKGYFDEKALEAIMELLNMIVGRFLTSAYGEEPIFDLGLPCPIEGGIPATSNAARRVWLDAEDSPVLISLIA